MDASLSAAMTTGVQDIADGAIAALTTNLPIALGVVVSVAVLFFGIRTFRAIAHV